MKNFTVLLLTATLAIAAEVEHRNTFNAAFGRPPMGQRGFAPNLTHSHEHDHPKIDDAIAKSEAVVVDLTARVAAISASCSGGAAADTTQLEADFATLDGLISPLNTLSAENEIKVLTLANALVVMQT